MNNRKNLASVAVAVINFIWFNFEVLVLPLHVRALKFISVFTMMRMMFF